MIEASAGALATAKGVASHVTKWLVNLKRANRERQEQSLRAVNMVTSLARRTRAYSRGIAAGQQNYSTEADLAASWSDVSFELELLGLSVLAKKCDLKSRYWADPQQFFSGSLAEADISFETVERLARELVVQIRLGKQPKQSVGR